ncbi:MAG: hypothetical protein ACE5FS_01385 [Paracoccaceae bacterium]
MGIMVRLEGIIVPVTMAVASVAIVAVAIQFSGRQGVSDAKVETRYSGVLSRSDNLRLNTTKVGTFAPAGRSPASAGSAAHLFVKAPSRTD